MKKSKLFLDIDGVLNTKEFIGNADFHSAIYSNRPFIKSKLNFNDDCVNRVKLLQQSYNLDVVICSNWRYGVNGSHFLQIFKLFDWNLETIAMTDTLLDESEVKRSKIIEKYILENYVQKYVILDDTIENYESLFDNLVLTDRKIGFTFDDYRKAETILSQ